MRKGWEIKKLGDVAKAIYGYTDKASFEEVGPKFLRITDIQDDGVDWESVPYCRINEIEFEKYKLSSGDIVFARTGATTGKSYLVSNPPKSVFASYLIKVHINTKDLLPNYLFLFFQTKTYWGKINAGVSGSAQGGFNAAKLSELEIPFPPVKEQQHLIAILEEAFSAIDQAKENIQRNLQNAKELFQSELNSIFETKREGWIEKKFSECFKLKSGDMMTAKMMNANGEFPVYGGNGISGKHDSYNLSGENIIIGRVGALCGNVRFINEKIWLTDNAFQIVDFQFKFDYSFLTYLLNFKDLRVAARQTAQPVISNSSLKDIMLQFPKNKKEQEKIVRQLDTLSTETKKIGNIYQKKIDNLEELKKSILQKAFSGQLSESGFAGLEDKQDKSKKEIKKILKSI